LNKYENKKSYEKKRQNSAKSGDYSEEVHGRKKPYDSIAYNRDTKNKKNSKNYDYKRGSHVGK